MTSEETDQGNERAPEAILKICGRAPAPARMCSGRFVECHCPAGHRYEVQAGMAGKPARVVPANQRVKN